MSLLTDTGALSATERRRRPLGFGRRLRSLALLALVAGVAGLTLVPGASAGTYVIDNCPSAGNGDAGLVDGLRQPAEREGNV